jgi:SAM-dependent methyltransferase
LLSNSAGRVDLAEIYRKRASRKWIDRAIHFFEPPAPFIMNPAEPNDFPLGRWNLYIGGAGRTVAGYINLDLFRVPGVGVVADAELLPFVSGIFQRIECDAVLEHVRDPERVMQEMCRVLRPGGYLHIVTPFCHPFHEYPKDYRRFTIDGLKLLSGPLKEVASGWRTGPAATMLVISIEFVKGLLPFRPWRACTHFLCGWLVFPLRYLDLLLLRSPDARRIGNHCYIWLQKPSETERT